MFLRCIFLFLLVTQLFSKGKVLYIYSWYDYIPPALIKKFEAETGIKVYIDYFDSSAMLESQWLAKSSGYDLVVPGAYPYAKRHIENGLYQKIEVQKIPNYHYIEPEILKNLKEADPEESYLIPYIWGIVGLGVNREILDKVLPDFKGNPADLIFNLDYVQKLSPYGIYLIDEPLELFASILSYLGYSPSSENDQEITKAFHHLRKISRYVRKFDMYRGISDFSNHEVAIIQTYNMHVANSKRNQLDKKKAAPLEFLIPENGVSFWVDCFAIPVEARHIEEAHAFLNFILNPENAAEVTKATDQAVANKGIFDYLPDDLKNNTLIFPDLKDLKVYVTTSKSREHERYLSRLMLKLKTGY